METPLTIEGVARALRTGAISSVAVTEAMLARADDLNDRLGTYVARFDAQALLAAANADAQFAAGIDVSPVQGIPIAIKDTIAAKEGPTTAQSLILDPAWAAGKDAPVVSRLREAGAVIIGKVTAMEFAVGVPDAAKPFPFPRNPWDLRRWAGGSSSGAANGVAAGMFLGAIGTDTAGSIRSPAAFCGVSGLKPTYGRVPKSGCVPLGYSLDVAGPIARSAHDCAMVLQVLAGYDRTDRSSAHGPVPHFAEGPDTQLIGMRIGVDREHHFPAGIDPALSAAFEDALVALKELGAILINVSLPLWDEVNLAVTVTWVAEAWAYHHQDLIARWNDYSSATRVLLARGAVVSGGDYVQAQKVRGAAQRSLANLFNDVDVVLAPGASTAAPSYNEQRNEMDVPLWMSPGTRLNPRAYWSGVGNPALVVPMGFNQGGLPLSLQIAGRPFEEAVVLRVGRAFQTQTDWHLKLPPLHNLSRRPEN